MINILDIDGLNEEAKAFIIYVIALRVKGATAGNIYFKEATGQFGAADIKYVMQMAIEEQETNLVADFVLVALDGKLSALVMRLVVDGDVVDGSLIQLQMRPIKKDGVRSLIEDMTFEFLPSKTELH